MDMVKGWICPKCNAGVAPHVNRCPCAPQVAFVPTPLIFGADDCCIDLAGHEYPNPWHGTGPASCKKCGKQSLPWTTFTVTSTTTSAT